MANTCAICGWQKLLTEHHIHPQVYRESYPFGPDNINDSANMVLLCRPCHDCVHEQKDLHILLREAKQKLRRPGKPKRFDSEQQEKQSEKDRARSLEGYQHLLTTLEDPEKLLKIESYRRILRTVERLHLRVLGKE